METFATQVPVFLAALSQRKRKPIKPSTISLWTSLTRVWIAPRIGSMPLETFGNGALKAFCDSLCFAQLAPRTVREVCGLTKRILASAVDQDGNERFPRKWRNDFLDLPEIKPPSTARTDSETIRELLNRTTSRYAVLYATLAATGLRVSEALSLRIGDDGVHSAWVQDEALLHIRTGVWRGKDVSSPKTQAGIRTVPLYPTINEMLIAFAGDRTGFLFAGRSGRPLSYALIHRNLKKLGSIRPHDFRRFRASQLRRSRVHADVVRSLLGHANESQTDEYSRLANLDELRKGVESAGLGFVFPEGLLGDQDQTEILHLHEFEEIVRPVAP